MNKFVGVVDHLCVNLLSGLDHLRLSLNLVGVTLPVLASGVCLDLGLASLVTPAALERGLLIDFALGYFNFSWRVEFFFHFDFVLETIQSDR